MSNSSSACFKIHVPTYLSVLMVIKPVISIIGIFATTLMIRMLWNCGGRVPFVVKCFILNVSLTYWLRNVFFGYKSLHDLAFLTLNFDNLRLGYRACFVEQSFFVGPSFSRYFSFLFVAINRLVLTIKSNTYDDKMGTITVMALVIAWIVPYSIYILLHFLSHEPNLCYCALGSMWRSSYIQLFNIFVMVLNLLIVCIYIIIYIRNQRILSEFVVTVVRRNLNERFVQWANIKTSAWLMPLTLSSLIISIVATLGSTTTRLYLTLDFSKSVILSILLTTIFSVESAVFPFLCIKFSEPLMQMVKGDYPAVYKMLNIGNRKESSTACNFESNEEFSNGGNKRAPTCGRKRILDYRLDPDAQADLLDNIWSVKEAKVTRL